ncbi:PREDICTED: LOW QUALITY PROTEIN: leucine zipper protein 4 [Condylura cristata]|uniref:LOW QUALITY PROTEIN: leucine zipper protein 4 n=1 Tax=Condylura cristata TaxID=143302 RepID=UPI000643C758|nr:PREDICTED: LOW QUALITY PROTEIN: leucine zipper protein 4 [Condylura cristata]
MARVCAELGNVGSLQQNWAKKAFAGLRVAFIHSRPPFPPRSRGAPADLYLRPAHVAAGSGRDVEPELEREPEPEWSLSPSLRSLTPTKCRENDIILLKNLNHQSPEEANKREDSPSRGRSHAPRYHPQRGHSKTGNNTEGKNHDKKPDQRSSGLKPRQSPLNRHPVNKQKKCNGGYKAQEEKNRDQSKWNQYPSGEPRGQYEENQYHSERSRGYLKRSHGQSERSYSYTERSHGQPERFYGHSGRDHGHRERYYGQSERSYGYSEDIMVTQRDLMTIQTDLLCYQSNIMTHQRGLISSQRDLMVGQKGIVTNQGDIDDTHQTYAMKRREEYFQKQKQQRNSQMNLHRRIILENDNSVNENDQGYQRSKRRITTLFLNNEYNATKSTVRKPRGICLKFNFQAMGNQYPRWSPNKSLRRPGSDAAGIPLQSCGADYQDWWLCP